MRLERADAFLAVGTAAGCAGFALLAIPAALLFLAAVCLALFGLHLYAEAHG